MFNILILLLFILYAKYTVKFFLNIERVSTLQQKHRQYIYYFCYVCIIMHYISVFARKKEILLKN